MLLAIHILSAAAPRSPWEFVRGLLLILAMVAIAVGLGYWSLKRSDEPGMLIVKWILSAFMGWVTLFKVGPLALANPFLGVPLTAACGLVFAVIWRDSIIAIISKPFASLYDGGDREVEPAPFYSLALAKRKRGQYTEAIADIRHQLEKFPDDFQGQFMIAEILVENLNDLSGADLAIRRLCDQKGQDPRRITMALNALADWQLKYGQDRDAARDALNRIIERYPDSEASALAAQRIAHLASTGRLVAGQQAHTIALKPGIPNLGLLPEDQRPKAPEVNPGLQAGEYVRHLESHPLDTEAREKLAILYASHFRRLDLATEQLEQLIGDPHQPAARTVHWLNVLADLQVEQGSDYDTIRATLQRIADRFPQLAAAEIAQNRISHLKLELRKRERSQTVKLGSYEQDIGLKGGG
jgi:TolA-binding protein